MLRPADTFKKWHFICDEHCHEFDDMRWETEGAPRCPTCDSPSDYYYPGTFGSIAPAVIGDEIDVMVRHGLCYEDGTPRRFTSMQELRRAAYDKGLSIYGETPNPNPRIVEGRQKNFEKTGRLSFADGE